jgi:tripartite-type tricarboxylate transporter receptor subunit TctC
LLVTTNALWVLPFIQKVNFDPVADFVPISTAALSPTILVVHPSLPAKSAKELIALAKAKPGELNYASAGTGSSPHLAAELFKAMAEVNIVRIPYKGSGPALNGLIGGQVQMMFGTAGSVSPLITSGKLRALAVTSAQPSPLFPGLPALADSGVPGYRSETVYGAFAPAGTPPAVVSRLNREIVLALERPEVKEKFLNAGVESAGSSPTQFAALIKSDMARMGKVIKDAGIRAD